MADRTIENGDRFEILLERYDEALLREGKATAACDASMTPRAAGEDQEDLDDAFLCLRLLEQVWPRRPREPGAPADKYALREGKGHLDRDCESDATIARGLGGDNAPVAKLPQGLVLGDFRLMRELGRGGMGIVYEAWQVSLSRRVAIKLLRAPALLLTEGSRKRFDNEARAAAALDNEHIVKIYAVGCEGETPYFAMQLIDGATLAEWIAQWRRRAPREAMGETSPLARAAESDKPMEGDSPSPGSAEFYRHIAQLCLQACLALDHAHAHGVIHRDVKPANMLVCREWRLWVTDFGLARIGVDSDLTLTGDLVGTLRYMSPEQALGKRIIDYRTDIYSLGATLYEMATLSPLFADDDRQALLHSIAHDSPTPPRKRAPHIPRDLETIILKATAKAASERYETAGQFGDDLRRFLSYEPIRARRATVGDLATKWVRRNSVTVAATLLTAALLLGVLLAMAWTQGNKYRKVANELRERLYSADMQSANRALVKGDIRAAVQYLDRFLPEAGEPDLRGFEWWLMRAQTQRDAKANQVTKKALYFVVHTRDGRRLATAGADAMVRIHDAPTGRILSQIQTGQGEVNGVAFSPDERKLATAGDDGTLRIWDSDSGQELMKTDAHQDKAYQVAFSPEGDEIFSCGGKDPNIRVWNAATGQSIGQIAGRAPLECLASAPHRHLLAAADELGAFFVVDMRTRQVIAERSHRLGRIAGLAFSPDGQLLAAAHVGESGNGKVAVWKGREFVLTKILDIPDPALSVAFSSDSKSLAVGDRAGNVSVFSVETRTIVHNAGSPMQWAALTHDAKKVAYLTDVGLYFHDLEADIDAPFQPDGQTGWNSRFARAIKERRTPLALSPDGRWFAIGNVIYRADSSPPFAWREHLRLWGESRHVDEPQVTNGVAESFKKSDAGESVGERDFVDGAFPKDLVQLAFAPDGEMLAKRRLNRPIELISPTTGETRGLIETMEGSGPLVFSHDSRSLAVAEGKVISLWDVDSLHRNELRFEHEGSVAALAFSPDGRWIASGDGQGAIVVWSLSADANWRLPVLGAPVGCLSWSGDSTLLATGVAPRQDHVVNPVRVWSLANRDRAPVEFVGNELSWVDWTRDSRLVVGTPSGFQRYSLRDSSEPEAYASKWLGHARRAYGVSFAPNGEGLASVGADGVLKIWPTAGRTVFHRVQSPVIGENVRAWLPDSSGVIFSDFGATLHRTDDASDPKPLLKLPAGNWYFRDYSTDRSLIALANNRQFLVWNTAQGRRLYGGAHATIDERFIAFSPDGRLLAVGANQADQVQFFDAVSGKPAGELPCPTSGVAHLAFSHDGKLLATSAENDVMVWRVATRERIAHFQGHESTVSAIVFSPHGDWLASVSHDRSLCVWDLASRRKRISAVEHAAAVFAVAASPEGRTLATGDEGGVVKLWSAVTGDLLLDVTRMAGTPIRRIEFSPDGTKLAWFQDGKIVICHPGTAAAASPISPTAF